MILLFEYILDYLGLQVIQHRSQLGYIKEGFLTEHVLHNGLKLCFLSYNIR